MSERDDMESTIRDRDSEIKALARDRDALAAKVARVEALAGERGEWIGYGGESGWVAESFDGGEPESLFKLATAANAPILAEQYNDFTTRLRAALAGPEDTARAEGVNEGIRLAADLVRGHVLAPNADGIVEFLISRADRAALAGPEYTARDTQRDDEGSGL